MTWVNPQVTIHNAEIAGQTVDGTFVFPSDIIVEFETRTEEFFQSSGRTPALMSVVLDWIQDETDDDVDSSIRQELSIDVGAGIHAITLDFRGYTGSPYQWGDSGEGGTPTDATGEDLHAQMAVFDRYLQAARIDSTNPAILEVGEYSEAGRYSPLQVVPENPDVVFDSTEQSSIYDGSVTWVETLSLEESLDGAKQTLG
ncbi:hypothetical protein RBH26_20555 [Natronolimnohabitans sp. A-GB9]|uniref:hypothetical protein n=1 Tax=Natronolimnohabitans sp. A-GB9 TaxID=3069757 RepID=UPI0027B606B5|nr:hypothetical protein [Natronolimnohabitans sp. A-GB9]MDQ2052836.1 hypothetical protein [Natronolimnohabitans sp. A-GB9]